MNRPLTTFCDKNMVTFGQVSMSNLGPSNLAVAGDGYLRKFGLKASWDDFKPSWNLLSHERLVELAVSLHRGSCTRSRLRARTK